MAEWESLRRLHVPAFLLDVDGFLQAATGPARRWLGISPDTLLPCAFTEVAPRAQALVENLRARDVYAAPVVMDLATGTLPGGRTLRVQLTAFPQAGSRTHLGILTDISDLTAAEVHATQQAISEDVPLGAEELRRLVRALDEVSTAVVLTDAAGSTHYLNAAFTAVSGFFPGEVFGRPILRFLAPPEEPAMLRQVLKDIRSGDGWSGTARIGRKAGGSTPVEARILPLRNLQGQVTHYLGLGEDLSRVHRLEAKVARMQRLEALGTLAAGVAHRFNNLLAGIVGQTDMLLLDPKLPPSAADRARKIHRVADQGRAFVQQFSLFQKGSTARRQPVDLTAVIGKALDFLDKVGPKQIKVETDLAPDLPPVLGTEEELTQVILNLLTNSLEAMRDKPGRLLIRLSASLPTALGGKTGVLLEIADQGHGIPPSIQHRIFEPFFTTRNLAESTGLGLSLVHAAVERHHGEIDFTSTPGEGTTFRLRLPAAGSSGANNLARGDGKALLLIDGRDTALAQALEQLHELGYVVNAFRTLADSLQVTRTPAVILFHATPMDALLREAVSALHDKWPDVPVVTCREPGEEALVDSSLQLTQLERPILLEELATALEAVTAPPREEA